MSEEGKIKERTSKATDTSVGTIVNNQHPTQTPPNEPIMNEKPINFLELFLQCQNFINSNPNCLQEYFADKIFNDQLTFVREQLISKISNNDYLQVDQMRLLQLKYEEMICDINSPFEWKSAFCRFYRIEALRECIIRAKLKLLNETDQPDNPLDTPEVKKQKEDRKQIKKNIIEKFSLMIRDIDNSINRFKLGRLIILFNKHLGSDINGNKINSDQNPQTQSSQQQYQQKQQQKKQQKKQQKQQLKQQLKQQQKQQLKQYLKQQQSESESLSSLSSLPSLSSSSSSSSSPSPSFASPSLRSQSLSLSSSIQNNDFIDNNNLIYFKILMMIGMHNKKTQYNLEERIRLGIQLRRLQLINSQWIKKVTDTVNNQVNNGNKDQEEDKTIIDLNNYRNEFHQTAIQEHILLQQIEMHQINKEIRQIYNKLNEQRMISDKFVIRNYFNDDFHTIIEHQSQIIKNLASSSSDIDNINKQIEYKQKINDLIHLTNSKINQQQQEEEQQLLKEQITKLNEIYDEIDERIKTIKIPNLSDKNNDDSIENDLNNIKQWKDQQNQPLFTQIENDTKYKLNEHGQLLLNKMKYNITKLKELKDKCKDYGKQYRKQKRQLRKILNMNNQQHQSQQQVVILEQKEKYQQLLEEEDEKVKVKEKEKVVDEIFDNQQHQPQQQQVVILEDKELEQQLYNSIEKFISSYSLLLFKYQYLQQLDYLQLSYDFKEIQNLNYIQQAYDAIIEIEKQIKDQIRNLEMELVANEKEHDSLKEMFNKNKTHNNIKDDEYDLLKKNDQFSEEMKQFAQDQVWKDLNGLGLNKSKNFKLNNANDGQVDYKYRISQIQRINQ